MKFNTVYDEHSRVFQPPGSPVKDVYSSRYSDSGVLELYVSGRENLYDFIQSHKDSVDIHVLLKRFANGEVDVLSRAQGFYMDASDMPKTLMEVLNSVHAGEQAFASLPADVKQRFNNSFSEWMASFESPDFLSRMGIEKPEASGSDLSDSAMKDFSGEKSSPGSTIVGSSSNPVSSVLGGDNK